jgi:hypothetical protein
MVFVVFGILNRNGYLATRPRQNLSDPTKQRDEGEALEEFNEWHREQTFSATLAGFSLTALVFILGFEDVSNLQRMVEFFVIGFTLEMLSFLSYKYMIKRGYEYFGTVFQFSGLLAMYSGFFVFIISQSMFSGVMFVIFMGGYVVFFVLSAKQLGVYLNMFK